MGGRPAFAWLQFVRLQRIEADRAVLAPLPGRREVLGFATEDRLKSVAEELGNLVGRRLRVVMEREPGGAGAGSDAGEAGDPGGGPGPARGGGARADRQQAMSLPLVKQALEAFPDASLVGVRREKPAAPAPGEPADAEAGEMKDDDVDAG